ncbi:MAG TPA: hypothetical protein VL400_07920 [Polyangiaceae bacterium]|nr:hypothetical protein [Polyangiaceae bacterium]
MALAVAAWGCGTVTRPSSVAQGDPHAVHVRLESPVPARLVEIAPRDRQTACELPCDRDIDVSGRSFRVESPEYEPTRAFEIPAAKRGVVVHYGPDATGESLGLGLLVVPGVTAAAVGGTLMLLDASGRDDFTGTMVPGGILIAAGVSVAVGGFVLWALARSSVTLDEAVQTSARGLTWD